MEKEPECGVALQSIRQDQVERIYRMLQRATASYGLFNIWLPQILFCEYVDILSDLNVV